MSYVVYRKALTVQEVALLNTMCEDEYNDLVSSNKVVSYPRRRELSMYPGTELRVSSNDVLQYAFRFATKSSARLSGTVDVDDGPGTGCTYINAQSGEQLSQHIDKPMYVLDSNFKVLPEHENRACGKTVVLCLTSDYVGGDIDIWINERDVEIVRLEAGDVLVVDGVVPHALSQIESGCFLALCCFLCYTI